MTIGTPCRQITFEDHHLSDVLERASIGVKKTPYDQYHFNITSVHVSFMDDYIWVLEIIGEDHTVSKE
jgi:hypothetical protein